MNLFLGHILYNEKEGILYTVTGFKNQNTLLLQNVDLQKSIKESMSNIEDHYIILKPVGFIGFNIVDLKNNLQDVIVSLFRYEDIQQTPAVPYAVCRQCIIDFLYQQIDPKTEYTGISISQETCPSNVDFNVMLACDKTHTGTMVAIYLDYTLDYILSLIKTKPFDDVLYCNLLDHAKHESEQYGGSYMYKQIIGKDCSKGYCKDLKTLLNMNNFMYDVHRAFKIYDLDFEDMKDHQGHSLSMEETKVISTLICKNITATLVVEYDYDIDIKNIGQNYILVNDKFNKLYVVCYIEDKTRPYIVPVEDIESDENIVKLNNVMTKAGKEDISIKEAYSHISFNQTKYN